MPKYKVVNTKIIAQVSEDYVVPTYPDGFPDTMRETLIECLDLGELLLIYTPTVLIFEQSLGGYRYTYVSASVVDNTPTIKAEIKRTYNQALAEQVKNLLNSVNLNEEKIHRKYLLYLTDPNAPAYSQYKVDFDLLHTTVNTFLIPYQTEAD